MKRKESKSKSKRLGCASVVVIVILALSAFTAVPVSAAVATVTRDLPVVVPLSETFDVTLMQTNFLFNVGTVTETLPAGFAYVDGSYTGSGAVTYNAATRTLTMGFREDTVVTYTVTASNFDQTATFAGTYGTVVPNPDPDPAAPPFIYESGAVGGDTEMGVDGTAPYTEGHNPAKGATGVPVDTNIVVYVRDNYALDPNSVEMTVDVVDVTSQLSLTPLALGNWLVTYNPPANLTFNHLYTITIDAEDAAGNVMTQDVYTFRTEQAPVPDEEPPVISNVASSSITNNSATITWDTDEVSDSLVKYGTTSGTYTMQESDAIDVTSHSVGLTGLNPNTTYYYVVNSTDPSGNSAESGENSFTTFPEAPCFAIDFAAGYNMITMPRDDPSVILASHLANKIGVNVTEVVRWNSATQMYVSFIPTVPLNNFDIVGGEGYLVNVNNPTPDVQFCGDGWVSPFDLSLVAGLNMIGMPVNDTSVTDASTLATKIGGNVTEVVRWNSATQMYVSFIPGVPLNNFDIVGGEGYFVNVNNPTDVTFAGVPWQD